MIFPESMDTILLETSFANSISWVIISIDIPFLLKLLINEATSFVNDGSKAEVGSSKHINLGFNAKALPIATLCFCPPDNSQG